MSAQDDKSYLTSIAIGFSIAITVIAVSLRLLARKLHKIPIGADDYAIIVGAVDLQRLETTKDSLGTDVRRFSPSVTPSFSFSVSQLQQHLPLPTNRTKYQRTNTATADIMSQFSLTI